MVDIQDKKKFRQEKCNIVEMTPEKRAILPKGSMFYLHYKVKKSLIDCLIAQTGQLHKQMNQMFYFLIQIQTN